jgi:galactose mutarotase-like enzyme
MSITLEHTLVDSFPAVVLANDSLRLVVIPDVGGKIVSLQSLASGREWLWKNPYLPLRRPPAGATNFGMFDAGGWDEVFPTVDPCRVPESPWGDRTLTDHGELWYRPWRIVSARVMPHEAAELTLAVDDADLPFRFERSLTLAAGSGALAASYELTNRSDRPLPYLWAAHPLLAIEPGDSIRLPEGSRTTSTGSVNLDFADAGASFAWPTARLASGETIDFAGVPDRAACIAAKLFAENVASGGIEIVAPDRDCFLRLSSDSEQVSHIGMWLNYGAWSGAGTESYFNAGIEPTNAPADNLSSATEQRTARLLLPGNTDRWSFSVRVGK